MSDRDVVFESRIIRDSPDKIRLEMKSVLHPKAPKTIGTRINIIFTHYINKRINPDKISVTFETLLPSLEALCPTSWSTGKREISHYNP